MGIELDKQISREQGFLDDFESFAIDPFFRDGGQEALKPLTLQIEESP
jgi:hypothetical protein